MRKLKTDKTDKKTVNREHLFKKGVSGNPSGRPKGSYNKITRDIKNIMFDEAGAISRKCVELAKAGNSKAMSICMDRLFVKPKHSPVEIKNFPNIDKMEDIPKLTNFILKKISSADITIEQGTLLAQISEKHSQNLQISELVKRIEELEERMS